MLGLQLTHKSIISLILYYLSISSIATWSSFDGKHQEKMVRKTNDVLQRSAIKQVDPTYPPLVKGMQVSGQVDVEVIIDEMGKVISASALSGHPLLRQPAVKAANQWVFSPTVVRGIPVKVIGILTFVFNLGKVNSNDDIQSLIERSHREPNSAEIHYDLAEAYRRSSRCIEAIEEYLKAIRINQGFFMAHYRLGECYRKQGRDKEAVKAFKATIRIKPDFVEAYFGLGWSLERLGQANEASTVWKKVLEVSPDLHIGQTAYTNLASIYKSLGLGEQAIEAYKQLISIEKQLMKLDSLSFTSADLYAKYIANIYESMGRNEEAIEAYKEAIELASNEAEAYWAYTDLANLYAKLNRSKEAIDAYETAIKLKPEWTKAHLELGLLHIKLGDKDSALKEQRVLERINPKAAQSLLLKIKN